MNKDRTTRYAHLVELSKLKVGGTVRYGDLVGIMGSSGQSKFNHLHIDVVIGLVYKIIRLSQIGPKKEYVPDKKQLKYFLDKDLFKTKLFITTTYLEKEYEKIYGKKHHAVDVVPKDRHRTKAHFGIYWNRTKIGTVLKSGFDINGYGYYILIGFSVK